MKLGQGVFVDARTHYEVHARYIATVVISASTTCRLISGPQSNALVVASRPIAAGDELYASYGPLYWLQAADMQRRTRRRLPRRRRRRSWRASASTRDGEQ